MSLRLEVKLTILAPPFLASVSRLALLALFEFVSALFCCYEFVPGVAPNALISPVISV